MSLAGTLDELALPDILQIVSLAEKTGRLTIVTAHGEGMIVFRAGRIIYASSNSARETFGSILVCMRLVDEAALRKALVRQHRSHEERRLGQILVEMGALRREDLDRVILRQVERVIGELFAWREGFFKFEPMDIPDRGEVSVDARDFLADSGLNAHKLALDLTRRYDETFAPPRPTPAATPVARAALGTAPTGAPTPNPPSATLREIIAHQTVPSLTGEVTIGLLGAAETVLARGILLLVEQFGAGGVGQFGAGADPAVADERVRELWIPHDEPSVVADVAASGRMYRGPLARTLVNGALVAALGGEWPDEVAALPVIAGERVAAVLVGDNRPTGAPIAGLEPLLAILADVGRAMHVAAGRQASAKPARHPAPPAPVVSHQ